jgi:hypothetical protein
MKQLVVLAVAALIAGGCSNQKGSDQLVKIGSKTLTKDDFEGYKKALQYYPQKLSDYFPDDASEITRFVEIEVLNSKASSYKSKVEGSKDWEWKQRFFPGQMYLIDYLPKTLDFTEQELKAYYDQNVEKYRTTVKVDSTGKDSSYTQGFEEVKSQIVETMFTAKYPPDSAFLAQYSQAPDSNTVKSEWVYSIRRKIPEFFMKQFFQKEYGKPYPDSVSEVYGEGKIITPADMDVIMSWIPEDRRSAYNEPQGNKELVEWLLKWKLFSKRAEAVGITKQPFYTSVMNYLLKICTVDSYVQTELGTTIPKEFPVDSEMVSFAIYDDSYSTSWSASPDDYKYKIAELQKTKQKIFYDSLLHSLRAQAKVTFFQNDYRDEQDKNPATLLHTADSLRDTGAVDQAESVYQTLAQEFLFSTEGKNALIELAKLQTEKQSYMQAISNYRKFLLLSPDASKRCNTFFMIGFIYDEHLNKPEKAERNYKWILKNARDCELADDAEFMVLHLDEPMSSVEELRAEALRQGRKIDSFDDESSVKTENASVAN